MCQCLLIEKTRTLNDFSQRIENLTGHSNRLEEIGFTSWINHFLEFKFPFENDLNTEVSFIVYRTLLE